MTTDSITEQAARLIDPQAFTDAAMSSPAAPWEGRRQKAREAAQRLIDARTLTGGPGVDEALCSAADRRGWAYAIEGATDEQLAQADSDYVNDVHQALAAVGAVAADSPANEVEAMGDHGSCSLCDADARGIIPAVRKVLVYHGAANVKAGAVAHDVTRALADAGLLTSEAPATEGEAAEVDLRAVRSDILWLAAREAGRRYQEGANAWGVTATTEEWLSRLANRARYEGFGECEVSR